jgi:ribonuclease G
MVSELRHLSADNTIEVITDIPYYYDLLNTHFKDNSNMSLRLYEDELLPLYKLYSVEKTLSEALSRKVWLKCGAVL